MFFQYIPECFEGLRHHLGSSGHRWAVRAFMRRAEIARWTILLIQLITRMILVFSLRINFEAQFSFLICRINMIL